MQAGVQSQTAATGIAGDKAALFFENAANLQTGGLRPEQTGADSIQHWLITPDGMANAVVHVIGQP